MKERRRVKRYELPISGTFTPKGKAALPVRVLNVSTEAVLVRGPEPFLALKSGRLALDLEGGTFETAAVCIRASEKEPWDGAFLFTSASDKALELLSRALARHRGRPLENG